jgi:MFS family permease
VLVVIVYALKHPGLPHSEKAEKQALLPALTGMNNAIWLTALIWAAFNAAAISFITFASDYYMTTGINVTYAGFLTSLFMVGSLLFSPVVGYFTDKIGGQEFFIAGSSMAMAMLLFIVPRAVLNPLLLVLLIGVTAAFVPAPIFSLLPKFLPPRQFGLGYGVLSTCLNIGVLLGPFLVGYSFDKSGNYSYGFSLMALFSFVAALSALLLKLKTKKPPNI